MSSKSSPHVGRAFRVGDRERADDAVCILEFLELGILFRAVRRLLVLDVEPVRAVAAEHDVSVTAGRQQSLEGLEFVDSAGSVALFRLDDSLDVRFTLTLDDRVAGDPQYRLLLSVSAGS